MNEERKFETILACYDNVYDHIRHFRNAQWQVVALVVALLAGIYTTIPTSATQQGSSPTAATTISVSAGGSQGFKVLLTLFTTAVAIYGGWHLIDLQRGLTAQREMRRRLERYFEFHENEMFTKDDLFPYLAQDAPVSFTSGLGSLISWWLVIFLTAGYVAIKIWS